MTRPTLLDLCCCEGGAAKGYMEAGFNVTGVDIDGRFAKRYPANFVRAEAVDYLCRYGGKFDAIHVSPPCQGYSVTAHTLTPEQLARYPRLIPTFRDILRALGKPFIIENVVGAPLIDPVLLCGSMFDLTATDIDGTKLRLERHRIFESNLPIAAPRECFHDRSVRVAGIYGAGTQDRNQTGQNIRGGYTPVKSVRADLLGVHRMTQLGLSEAIPPAYTRHLGRFLMEAV